MEAADVVEVAVGCGDVYRVELQPGVADRDDAGEGIGIAGEPFNELFGLCPAQLALPLVGPALHFPQLVVESKKDFATRYGLTSEYWRHFDVAERPEVEAYLKTNLTDLANHYHALYQDEALAEEKPANYAEAQTWYRAFLASFPAAPESPGINYQLADLMLENADFAIGA